MSEELKLNFKTTAAGRPCATFMDIDGDCCVVEESKEGLLLWNDNQGYVWLTRIKRSQAASDYRN